MMKHSFNGDSWIWQKHRDDRLDAFQEVMQERPSFEKWLEELEDDYSNSLVIDTRAEGEEHLFGSLVYQQDIDSREDKKAFHFYVEKDCFITAGIELEDLRSNYSDAVFEQMDRADNAIEGFFILLGEIVAYYLSKIDIFEESLTDLIWKIKEQNNVQILEKIAESRHEILIWKNLMIPIIELKIAAEEAFGESIAEKKEFKRVCKRIERGRTLIREYQQEIDTMINLEEVVSSHRGNEIMKTLTVMTILFTPVAALGALWGMNFEVMPELKWRYGYPASIVLIILSTVALYIYLWRKGWTGDVLKTKKKNTFFQ
jgi:Mg2+ and Co2+ transporter CorA